MTRLSRKTLTPLAASSMQTAIQTAPRSLDELVAISGLSKPTVTRYVKELGDARLVYVADWARDRRGYPTIRQYGWGDLPNVACPKTVRTAAERMRVLRTNRKTHA